MIGQSQSFDSSASPYRHYTLSARQPQHIFSADVVTVTLRKIISPGDAGMRAQDWVPDPVLTRAMDVIMILHMDHEQNASTSTVRVAGSSQANPYACIAAGIACLWGPAHGGANEAVRAARSPHTRAPPLTHAHTYTRDSSLSARNAFSAAWSPTSSL